MPSKKSVVIDVSSGSIVLSMDPVPLNQNQHFAEWRMKTGQDYNFDIQIAGPGHRPPTKHLPQPTCTGSHPNKTCKTIVPNNDNYNGDHKYKVTVYVGSSKLNKDPQVSVDP